MTDELKLQGTAREAENSHAITAIFNRPPTDDEMRVIHAAIAVWNTRAEPSVQEAADFDRQDWYWRDMDPDDSGDNPHQALRYLPDLCVAMIRSSTTGPTRYAFRATVLDPDSDDTEVLHFSTEEEALKAREDRAAALRAIAEKDTPNA